MPSLLTQPQFRRLSLTRLLQRPRRQAWIYRRLSMLPKCRVSRQRNHRSNPLLRAQTLISSRFSRNPIRQLVSSRCRFPPRRNRKPSLRERNRPRHVWRLVLTRLSRPRSETRYPSPRKRRSRLNRRQKMTTGTVVQPCRQSWAQHVRNGNQDHDLTLDLRHDPSNPRRNPASGHRPQPRK